jgi:hypothetical protein
LFASHSPEADPIAVDDPLKAEVFGLVGLVVALHEAPGTMSKSIEADFGTIGQEVAQTPTNLSFPIDMGCVR